MSRCYVYDINVLNLHSGEAFRSTTNTSKHRSIVVVLAHSSLVDDGERLGLINYFVTIVKEIKLKFTDKSRF